MLKKIILNNYTTFINKTELNFTATNSKILDEENVTKDRILKGAVFVGENASGKTNILNAINLLLKILTGTKTIDYGVYKSFYTDHPTYSVTYEFLINHDNIIYELILDTKGIVSEKVTQNKLVVLKRTKRKASFVTNGNIINRNNVPETLSFFRDIYYSTQFYNNKTLNLFYEFILNSIYIDCANQHIKTTNQHTLEEITPDNYFTNNGVEEINNFFKKINYYQNIIYTNSSPKSKISSFSWTSPKPSIAFKKNNTDLYIPEPFESTGNRNLLYILPAFLSIIKHPGMIIVNEFSSGLHNDLEEALVKYFFHYSKHSQLFFTTHSTNILNHSIVRPDQEYSIRFDYTAGGSLISRFSDQNPREAQNSEKMYLNGVFDEVPHYTKHFTD